MAIVKSIFGVVAGATVFAAAGDALASEAVLRGCRTQIKSILSSAYRFPAAKSGVFMAPAPADPGPDTCSNYTWVYRSQSSWYFSVMPLWSGPVSSFCAHSTIEYALYFSWLGGWWYGGGGQLWGKDTGTGGCTYSVSNWPDISYGADMTSAALPSGVGNFLVAVKTSAHNHSGNDCGGATSCYWPTGLLYLAP